MMWVVDCSLTSSLFLPDEDSAGADRFFRQIPETENLLVPSLWWVETANVLATARKKNLFSHASAAAAMDLLQQMAFHTDDTSGHSYLTALFDLASLYRLTAYDAAYLELAMRKKSGLASLDRELCRAGQAAGVKTFGPA